MVEPAGGYTGHAVIDGHAADVTLIAAVDSADGTSWSGSAFIKDPAVDLLEFTGEIEIVVGDHVARARITDATPGSRFIYFRGRHQPPFEPG